MRSRVILIAGLIVALAPPAALAEMARATPWLCGVTQNTVYVGLEATNTTAATVKYGLTNAYGSTASTQNTQAVGSNYVHNVNLTGLLPNTQYHYQVVQGSSVSGDYTFYTAPVAGTTARWGFAADSRTQTTIHNNMAALIAGQNPRMMVYGGDLCDAWSEWFVPNQESLNATVPWVNAPGNHEGWNATTRAYTQSAGGDPDYFSFDYGDSHIVVLNTEISYSSGSPQWNFAAADLATSTAAWKVVAFHKPAYSTSRSDAGMQAMTAQIFEPNGVDLVLTGHDHYYQHNLVNGIHHMVIGSFGAPLYGVGTAPYTVYSESTYCFGIIETTPNVLTLTTYRTNGSVIEVIQVPEPAGLSLLVLGGLALIRRRRGGRLPSP